MEKEKGKKQKMARLRSSDLPEEVAEEILSRLPADSLMRFKCVCKSWYVLIRNPKFVAKQLLFQAKSSSTNKENICLLLKRWVRSSTDRRGNVLSLLCFDYKTRTTGGKYVSMTKKNLDLPFFENAGHLNVHGHCDGIICVSDDRDGIFLANPGIREFRQLPKSCIPLPTLGLDPEKLTYRVSGVGFGYDPKTNDYNVVRIFEFRKHMYYARRSRAEVYTLSTDSWREISNLVKGISIQRSVSFERYFNGAYYWWAKDVNILRNGDFKDVILSFDMGDEVFRKIPMPDSSIVYQPYRWSLVVLNESIALILYPCVALRKSFEIWIMDEFGINGSWAKLTTIGPLLKIDNPLVFLNILNNNVLLLEDWDGWLVAYNLSNKEILDLRIRGCILSTSALIYLRSLVSVRGGYKLDRGDYIIPLI